MTFPMACPAPIGQKPEGSKVERMMAESAKIEAGHVHLPKEAEWLDTFLLELLAFPYGRHDDQVDSTSQFLKWAAKRRSFDPPFETGLPIGSIQGVPFASASSGPCGPHPATKSFSNPSSWASAS
jgi:hypothetical protein